jgi:hypothetical protein
MRACTLMENYELAEEIYSVVISKYKVLTNTPIGIQFYNLMLENYAEARVDLYEVFFKQMIQKKLPVNGATFSAYAKGIIFRDEREKLINMVELMRVEGVLQSELSKPMRSEIFSAFHNKSTFYKTKNRGMLEFMKDGKEDPFLEFRDLKGSNSQPWGRHVDTKSLSLMSLMKPHIDRYTFSNLYF